MCIIIHILNQDVFAIFYPENEIYELIIYRRRPVVLKPPTSNYVIENIIKQIATNIQYRLTIVFINLTYTYFFFFNRYFHGDNVFPVEFV